MRGDGKVGVIGAAALCAAALLLGVAPSAQGAEEPLFVYVPAPQPGQPSPPPTSRFNGPCGLAVDSSGDFYVSDYYHDAVDVFVPPGAPYTTSPFYKAQLTPVDSLDGPCGLALDAAANLYVNVYHRSVAKFGPSPGFGAGPIVSAEHPTGVAVEQASGQVYVNERTRIAVYDPAGSPLLDEEGQPIAIGAGTLQDGYGLALSEHPATQGRLYVADAATDTVKVYDPAVDPVDPVAEIDHPEGFVSLRDSALAVDRVTGDLYVADNNQPAFAERPEATIHVFDSTGGYEGHLKYNVVDALPPGLAVDNSATSTQGRVYVTSGNTDQAGVYAYSPGAATKNAPQPPAFSLTLRAGGSGSGRISATVAEIECGSSCEAQVRSGADVTLTATAGQDSAFAGFSAGGCGAGATCTVRMEGARSVSASFVAAASPDGGGGQSTSTPASSPTPPAADAVALPRRAAHRHGAHRRRLQRRCRAARARHRAHRRRLVRRRAGIVPRHRRALRRKHRALRRLCGPKRRKLQRRLR